MKFVTNNSNLIGKFIGADVISSSKIQRIHYLNLVDWGSYIFFIEWLQMQKCTNLKSS